MNKMMPSEEWNSLKDKQDKLYRHSLKFSAADTSNNALSFMMGFISTNDLKVDNLQDLTLVLKPTENSEYPVGTVVNVDTGAIMEYNYITYFNGHWKLSSSDTELTELDFAVMGDSVTNL